VTWLIGPRDRKSIVPMAVRMAPGKYDERHHLIADGESWLGKTGQNDKWIFRLTAAT
jgi:hypothetical protein